MPTNDFNELIDYAALYHRGQYRKGRLGAELKLPYIMHPLDVVKQLYSWELDKSKHYDLFKAALFHDALEDTAMLRCDLLSRVGQKAFDIVVELTMPKEADKAKYVATFKDKSIEAVIIKVADRVCNIKDFMMCGEYYYARKYYNKADPLFRAYMDRQDEIKSFGNSRLYSHISLDVSQLHDLLV